MAKEAPPPLPPTAEALAGKAKDLEALRDAVVDAASVGAGLWFSYLFVLFYLLIAVGSVTHRDLFLESPIRLPFLNVDLPLLGFFWLGPAIFLIVHAYVLLHFVLLAGKVGDFYTELKAQIKDEDVRSRLRRQLPSNIFVQFLAGPRETRSGVLGFLLQLIAQISLVIGPIALLVFFELQFLPYHDEKISWWHRIAVLADIVLLWILWPPIARGKRAGLSRADLRHGKIVALAFASLVPVLLVTAIATIPGEWPQDNLPSLQFVPWRDGKDTPWHLTSLRELLVAGDVDFAGRKPKSLWSNRLVLPGFDAIDHAKFDSEAKIEAASETISLRAHHLEGGVLIGAKLRKADFTAAQLQGAQLDDSDLRGAKFQCVQQQCTQIEGASVDNSQLLGASLYRVQLQGARLYGSQLQGASLDGAQLQGASLYDVGLAGVSLGSVSTWRADAREAYWEDTLVGSPDTGPKYECTKNGELSICDWSPQSFDELKQQIAVQVPEGDKRSAALKRIEKLDPTKALEGEYEMAKVWEAQARSSPATEAYEKRLAGIWRETGCAAEGAPYVLRNLLVRLEWAFTSYFSPSCAVRNLQGPVLASAFLDEAHCPGARGLTDAEKAELEEIRDHPPPSASKPN
jgi:Pentapeptide repeats (8 copies)